MVSRCQVPFAVAIVTLAIPSSHLAAQSPVMPVPSAVSAQSSGPTTGLIVPITGVADFGGFFTGALLIQRFAAEANGIVAVGIVTGTLVANGTYRNVVVQTALPLDLNVSVAGLATDAALGQSSCNMLHVDLGGVTMNVVGSNIVMNPVAFDVASAIATSTTSGTSSPSAAGGSLSTAADAGTPFLNTTQSFGSTPSSTDFPAVPAISATSPAAAAGVTNATAVPTPSNTGSTSTSTGFTTTAPGSTPTTTPVAGQTPLEAALCAVNGFRDSSNPTRLAQQLNTILLALANPQGS